MAWVAPVLMGASTLLGFGASRKEARNARARGRAEAAQRRVDANLIAGESQKSALNYKRQAKLLASRAKAVAAASGAGTDNITVENILGDIEAQGEYQKMAMLYQGETERQKQLEMAKVAEMAGSAGYQAANLQAYSTLLGGAADWYSRYGK